MSVGDVIVYGKETSTVAMMVTGGKVWIGIR